MKITNKYKFDSLFVDWLTFDEYDYEEDTISTTEFKKPLRAKILERRYKDKLEVDVNDFVATRYGVAIHDSFEKLPLKDCIQEQRLRSFIDGYVVTGKFDILQKQGDEYMLADVKSTSVWTYVFGSKLSDYIDQLSVYRFLARRNGYNVKKTAKILFVFTDWKKSDAMNKKDYPKSRLATQEITLKDTVEVEDEIKSYISELKAYKDVPDNKLPFCSADELWKSEDTYAVKKEGVQRARKVFKNKDEANEYVNGLGAVEKKLYVEERLGKVKRCNYCVCKSVCVQYDQLITAGVIDG